MEKPILQDSPSFVDLCTLHQHAMRYYRLWIYACNTVLALATLVFTVFAVSVIVDPRFSLINGVELYQPTFLYAYVALIFQCGVLQAIGCVGALRLNQRLLNIYWMTLLILMIGDVLTGLFWAFRLDQIKSELRPMLKQKLITLYGKDEDFTEVWDWVQTNDMCCGVDGPIDFQRINESTYATFDSIELANETWSSYLFQQQEKIQNQESIPKLPSTCCMFTVNHNPGTTADPPISSEVPGGGGGGSGSSRSRSHHKGRGAGSAAGGGGTSKGDRWNDPMNPMPGGYYQQPQQLKGSFQNSNSYNNNQNYPTVPSYSDNNIQTIMNSHENTYSGHKHENNNSSQSSNDATAIVMSNNLVVSDLRQFPLTDQISGVPASAMGYFAPGPGSPGPPPVGGYHNRRRLAHKNKVPYDDLGYPDSTRWGRRGAVTTTEGPQTGRPSPAVIGLCVLPSKIDHRYSSSSSFSQANSGESGSSEESSEVFSTTSLPPPHTPPPSTLGTSKPTSMPNNKEVPSGIFSTQQPASDSPHISSSPTSAPPISAHGKQHDRPSNGGSQHHRRHHHSYPFRVNIEGQHKDGCGDKIYDWVEHSSDVLFVIGFCIIVFLKGCFIAILRYEIKEMIEKIKLLNGEDPSRTAAMNELIGLTSMYETGNDDNGETEGLMSGVHNGNQDINTNLDTIDGDNGSGGGAMTSSVGVTSGGASRKDSANYVKENHLVGNNVGPPRYIGNCVGSIGSVTVSTDEYQRALSGTRDHSVSGVSVVKHDLDGDFIDSRSSLLVNRNSDLINDNPTMIGNNKHFIQFPNLHHRNENGGRTVPRNGNNNNPLGTVLSTATGGTFDISGGHGPISASVPSIPIDAIARVTNPPIH